MLTTWNVLTKTLAGLQKSMSAQVKMPKYLKDASEVKNSGSFGQLNCFCHKKGCIVCWQKSILEKESNGWNQ